MKIKFAAALIIFTFLSTPLFAGNNDLSYIAKSGNITQMIVINFSSKTIVQKGRKGNAPLQTLRRYQITSVDSTSAYPHSRQSMIIHYNDGSGGNSYLLKNDLTRLQVGSTYFYLNTPLNFFHKSGSRKYKYILEPNVQKGAYYTSSGAAWQKLSDFHIISVKDEGKKINGTPVFTIYFKSNNGVSNTLMVSTQWDKMVGALNKWFYRSK